MPIDWCRTNPPMWTLAVAGKLDFTSLNADVIRGETSYEFRRLRDTCLERARWAPILTAYGRVRTGFDVPTTQP